MADSTITVETLDAKQTDATAPEITPGDPPVPVAETPVEKKYVRVLAPSMYDEVLAIIPRRLFRTFAVEPLPGFFLDVIEAYIPTLLGEIRRHCGDDNRDALAAGENAVRNLRRAVKNLRELPYGSPFVDYGYAAVIEAFAAAHNEKFNEESDFAQDFARWKRGV